jgi:hypothetical protein
MKTHFILALALFASFSSFGQTIFKTESKVVSILINNQVVVEKWNVSPEIKPDIFEAECSRKINIVTFKADKDSIFFNLSVGKTIDFIIQNSKNEQAYTQIKGIIPNVNFTKEYIKANDSKTIVQIPEVSELVNILMVLHKDAEKDSNMFDTKIDYYKEVKEYFKPYLSHPALDTINKYITDLKYSEDAKISLFSNQSYYYYYALKMNACAYEFDKNGKIKNNQIVKEFAKGWYSFDPMKDVKLFEDFSKKSNFRVFYKNHKTYYDSLIATYNQLNPISKMQNWLDKKFGFGYGSYVVYFSPFISGAHSTQSFESNNFNQSFMFIAKAEMDKDYSPVMNELIESRVVFTEIDHNYVNPISDKYLERINKSFSNREKWAKGEVTSLYKVPYMVFNEYMTFAVYSLYVQDNYSKDDLIEYLPKLENQMEESRGFINFKKFNRKLLEKYEENKNIKMTDLYDYILNWADNENK